MALEAIDQFYHDNIHQYENDQEPLIGKALLKAKELAIISEVTLNSSKIFNTAIDQANDKVSGEMIFEFKSKDFGVKRLTERFVQIWEDNKIIEQRFYYNGVENV
jgi:hypothetical protein